MSSAYERWFVHVRISIILQNNNEYILFVMIKNHVRMNIIFQNNNEYTQFVMMIKNTEDKNSVIFQSN